MTDETRTTAPASPEVTLALALARDRTSPPEAATPDKSDRAKAHRLIAALRAAGWRLFR